MAMGIDQARQERPAFAVDLTFDRPIEPSVRRMSWSTLPSSPASPPNR